MMAPRLRAGACGRRQPEAPGARERDPCHSVLNSRLSSCVPVSSLTGNGGRFPIDGVRRSRVPTSCLIFPDNLGWGEVGAYGSVRGVPTPRIDKLAAEGIRLNNFNVEFSCTVSRAALLTGRYADSQRRDAAGRHHAVGGHDRRGAQVGRLRDGALRQVAPRRRSRPKAGASRRIRASTSGTAFRAPATRRRPRSRRDRPTPDTSYIWEGKAGAPPRKVKLFDLETRRTVDREAAERGIDFMERSVKAQEAVLPLLPDDADPFSDAGASRLRRQDRRGRHRRRDGRRRPQRRPRARRDRSGSASRATPSCSGAPTTAPSRGARGAARRAVERLLQHA